MHPVLRVAARREAWAYGRQRYKRNAERKRFTSLIQQEVRAQLREQRAAQQVCCHCRDDLGFLSLWTGAMVGIIIAHVWHRFKNPPKTIEEMWLEVEATQ